MRLQTQLLIFAIAFAGCGTGVRDGRCDCDVGEACIEGTCIPRDRPEMLSVAAGAYTMGTPLTESDRDEDEVEHEVTISALYAAKIDVTQAQYEAIMGENPSILHLPHLPGRRRELVRRSEVRERALHSRGPLDLLRH